MTPDKAAELLEEMASYAGVGLHISADRCMALYAGRDALRAAARSLSGGGVSPRALEWFNAIAKENPSGKKHAEAILAALSSGSPPHVHNFEQACCGNTESGACRGECSVAFCEGCGHSEPWCGSSGSPAPGGEDTARLDWLETHGEGVTRATSGAWWATPRINDPLGSHSRCAQTPRTAIDAARALPSPAAEGRSR